MNESEVENETLEDTSRETLKLSLSAAYFLMFIVGMIGNGIVIVMIINVLTSMRRSLARGKRRSITNTNHVFIYVLGLSIVDLLVLFHLPFLVVDLLKGQWLFGSAMCKLYWFGESVNKLLSSFIMTVLSWDRYLAVCSPVKSIRIRSNTVSVLVLLICSLLAVVLLLPVLIQATVFKIDRMKMITLAEDSVELRESDLHGTTMSKCMFDADATFTLYTFVIGFALPAILITMFYSQVIYKLHKHSCNFRTADGILPNMRKRSTASSSMRVKKVTKRIIAVILFYFLCWTPQWTLNMMSQFNLVQVSWGTPALSALFFIAHLLVCFNSAANPVLYALINRELRQQHVMAMAKKRQSFTHATQGALEFVARHTHNIAHPCGAKTSTSPYNVLYSEEKRDSLWMTARKRLSGVRESLLGMRRAASRTPSINSAASFKRESTKDYGKSATTPLSTRTSSIPNMVNASSNPLVEILVPENTDDFL